MATTTPPQTQAASHAAEPAAAGTLQTFAVIVGALVLWIAAGVFFGYAGVIIVALLAVLGIFVWLLMLTFG